MEGDLEDCQEPRDVVFAMSSHVGPFSAIHEYCVVSAFMRAFSSAGRMNCLSGIGAKRF